MRTERALKNLENGKEKVEKGYWSETLKGNLGTYVNAHLIQQRFAMFKQEDMCDKERNNTIGG